MIRSIHKKQPSLPYKILCGFTAVTFLAGVILPPQVAWAQAGTTLLNLPVPGTMVPPSRGFIPAIMTGVTVHPDDPLRFDFIIDTGHTDLKGEPLKAESRKLIKYFLAALTVPEDELWVNLSPYEQDRMAAPGLGKTEMGRDMLAQDYLLKQLTASLMYPEKELGKKFWDRVYKKVQEQFGTTDIPVNTFNKVWVVPEEAVVYEQGTSAFVIKSRLAVMLESDYEAMSHQSSDVSHQKNGGSDNLTTEDRRVTTQIIREVIIPEIEKEVNEGETFANLRQIYNSLILATWYKQKLIVGAENFQPLLGQIYANQNKTKGINPDDPAVNQKIYDRYIASFEKGVYNYIKEDVDPATQQVVPRKYFSGGVNTYNPRPGKGWLSRMIAAAALTVSLLAGSPASVKAEVSGALAGVGTKFGVTTQLVENAAGDAENTSAIVVHKGLAPEPLLLARDETVYPESFGEAPEGGRAQGRMASSPAEEGSPKLGPATPSNAQAALELYIRTGDENFLEEVSGWIERISKSELESQAPLIEGLWKMQADTTLNDDERARARKIIQSLPGKMIANLLKYYQTPKGQVFYDGTMKDLMKIREKADKQSAEDGTKERSVSSQDSGGEVASSPVGVSPSMVGRRNNVGTFLPLQQVRSQEDWGIGDWGVMKKAVDLHAAWGQNIIQLLPSNLSSAGNSPYSLASSKLLDPNTISVQGLVKEWKSAGISVEGAEEFIEENRRDIEALRDSATIDHAGVHRLKMAALKIIWDSFKTRDDTQLFREFTQFQDEHRGWLSDHLLYIILKNRFMGEKSSGWDWRTWPEAFRDRHPEAITNKKGEYHEDIAFGAFVQFVAYRQYQQFREYANNRGVEVILDMPYALDGADIWLNPGVFGLTKENGYKALVKQGVPPENAYPGGQYWQFFQFDWDHPDTIPFILDRFQYLQGLASQIRLDHVLGYYRKYLFTEDVDARMTLGELGLYDEIKLLQRRANVLDTDEAMEETVGKVKALIIRKLLEIRENLPDGLQGALPPDAIPLTMDENGEVSHDSMLFIARRVADDRLPDELPEGSPWQREKYVVEKAVYQNQSRWDFLRLTPNEVVKDQGFLYEYLFPGDGSEIKPDDSIRLGYFELMPHAEALMSEFLRLAQKKGTPLIWETLGVVPSEIQESVERLGGTNYIPVIWGETSSWGAKRNPYHPSNHIENAFATFSLHDSTTMRNRWENELDRATKQMMLDGFFGKGHWGETDLRTLTYKVREKLLDSVYSSRARIAVLTWLDLLGLGEEYRLNVPGKGGQWVRRLPKDVTLENLVQAANGEPASDAAREVAGLVRGLTEKGKRKPEAAGEDLKITHVTPEAGGKVMQLRSLGQEFLIDAYIEGAPRNVTLVVFDLKNNDARNNIGMRQVGTAAGFGEEWMPEKWTATVPSAKIGQFNFYIEAQGADGNRERSGIGRLVTVAHGADLNPLSGKYALSFSSSSPVTGEKQGSGKEVIVRSSRKEQEQRNRFEGEPLLQTRMLFQQVINSDILPLPEMMNEVMTTPFFMLAALEAGNVERVERAYQEVKGSLESLFIKEGDAWISATAIVTYLTILTGGITKTKEIMANMHRFAPNPRALYALGRFYMGGKKIDMDEVEIFFKERDILWNEGKATGLLEPGMHPDQGYAYLTLEERLDRVGGIAAGTLAIIRQGGVGSFTNFMSKIPKTAIYKNLKFQFARGLYLENLVEAQGDYRSADDAYEAAKRAVAEKKFGNDPVTLRVLSEESALMILARVLLKIEDRPLIIAPDARKSLEKTLALIEDKSTFTYQINEIANMFKISTGEVESIFGRSVLHLDRSELVEDRFVRALAESTGLTQKQIFGFIPDGEIWAEGPMEEFVNKVAAASGKAVTSQQIKSIWLGAADASYFMRSLASEASSRGNIIHPLEVVLKLIARGLVPDITRKWFIAPVVKEFNPESLDAQISEAVQWLGVSPERIMPFVKINEDYLVKKVASWTKKSPKEIQKFLISSWLGEMVDRSDLEDGGPERDFVLTNRFFYEVPQGLVKKLRKANYLPQDVSQKEQEQKLETIVLNSFNPENVINRIGTAFSWAIKSGLGRTDDPEGDPEIWNYLTTDRLNEAVVRILEQHKLFPLITKKWNKIHPVRTIPGDADVLGLLIKKFQPELPSQTPRLTDKTPKSSSPMVPVPVVSDQKKAPGGIDLNPALLNLQIRRDGNGVPLPLLQQPIETMRIDGFVPIIINITPIPNLPLLLGLTDKERDSQDIRASGHQGLEDPYIRRSGTEDLIVADSKISGDNLVTDSRFAE